MRILFVAGREPSYIRNAIMLKCLRMNGIELIDCSDSSTLYSVRFLKGIVRFLAQKNFDAVFIGFLGQPLVPIIRMLTTRPIIFDAFLSTYDTICFDRKRIKPDTLIGRFLYLLDKYSCIWADRVLLDTEAHIDFFTSTFELPRDKFHRMFVGADETLFYPRARSNKGGGTTVFYYSSFLPLHGSEYIIQAAALLRQENGVEFVLVGNGPEQPRIIELAQKLGANNIRFIDWLPYEQLPHEIAQADICLGGHFSNIDKAKRVIAGKTFQFMAMEKPVIVGDCVGNRELLIDRENALFVRMGDAQALAAAILELQNDQALRARIASAGYKTFMQICSISALGRDLGRLLGG